MVHSTGSWGEVSRRMHHAVGCSTISRQQHEAAPACWFCCSGLLGSLAQSERVDVGGRLKHRAAAVCPMIQLGWPVPLSAVPTGCPHCPCCRTSLPRTAAPTLSMAWTLARPPPTTGKYHRRPICGRHGSSECWLPSRTVRDPRRFTACMPSHASLRPQPLPTLSAPHFFAPPCRYSEVHNYNFSNPKAPRNPSYDYGMIGHFTQGAPFCSAAAY